MEQENVLINEISKEEKILQKKKNNNIKLYSIYRIFSFDLLFYYAIIYLFLTIEKGISPAKVLQYDAFYILFKFILQIPCTLLIHKLGKRRSNILANAILAIHVLVIIYSPDFFTLLVSQLLCAFSFNIKATSETDLLYDSLEHNEKRGHVFAKIDGKANARYYFIDSISAILSGFLFVINPYIPIILCFFNSLLLFFLSIKFKEIHPEKGKMEVKEEIKNIRYGFKNIFKSRRLMSLILFNAMFVGLIKILQNLRNAVLIEIHMPEEYFGIIFAVLGIISGISARFQGRIHKKFRNKTLAFLSYPTVLSFLMIGIVLIFNFNIEIKILLILILFAIQYIMKGPYYVLIKQYINNFTTSEKRIKISTVNNLIENLIASLLIFIAAFILEKVSVDNTVLVVSCIFIIVFTILLDYMRGTVGLKPEEYSKKEIL